MKIGDLVEADVFGGKVELKKVLAICGKTAYLTTLEEWNLAESEGREPNCVGFPIRYVRLAAA